ncbi:SDR family NAD(P)-dependent oxidoreductase [Paeniglutamicibacter kerguelensis]|uniref:NAD(P)-dependent dehydrogenase (Short-subunit alcohol dehydrogenase family) n=1 Tax=Paeniglutamicibacter kerguelensis TaxID=254788 RepID=A0ABS4XBK6_9MICC|nr:NAD(P)-dependent dehydrogenase (short-subunit alcohol dehydrogenase family) [Paeniglutamicibacter kerguelensis]
MNSSEVVVTGGGRGIGRAISLRLAQAGRDVVIGFRSDADSAESVAEEIRVLDQRALCVQVDTVDEASVAAMFEAAERFGRVTGVVNNAGAATAVGRLERNELAAIRRDIDVNLFGVIACCKYAQASLAKSGGGAIVNISSAAGTLGSPSTYVHYAAAKAGVDALTVGLSKELAPGIRVNAVSPGTIWTQFHQDPDRPAQVASVTPLGRAGEAAEIAGAAA